jgi:hypothetical protein
VRAARPQVRRGARAQALPPEGGAEQQQPEHQERADAPARVERGEVEDEDLAGGDEQQPEPTEAQPTERQLGQMLLSASSTRMCPSASATAGRRGRPGHAASEAFSESRRGASVTLSGTHQTLLSMSLDRGAYVTRRGGCGCAGSVDDDVA